MSAVLKFPPVSGAVDASFFSELGQRKLHEYKLDDAAVGRAKADGWRDGWRTSVGVHRDDVKRSARVRTEPKSEPLQPSSWHVAISRLRRGARSKSQEHAKATLLCLCKNPRLLLSTSCREIVSSLPRAHTVTHDARSERSSRPHGSSGWGASAPLSLTRTHASTSATPRTQ